MSNFTNLSQRAYRLELANYLEQQYPQQALFLSYLHALSILLLFSLKQVPLSIHLFFSLKQVPLPFTPPKLLILYSFTPQFLFL